MRREQLLQVRSQGHPILEHPQRDLQNLLKFNKQLVYSWRLAPSEFSQGAAPALSSGLARPLIGRSS